MGVFGFLADFDFRFFKSHIIDWRDLPLGKEYYTSGKLKSGIFGNEDLKFRMLAILLDFKECIC